MHIGFKTYFRSPTPTAGLRNKMNPVSSRYIQNTSQSTREAWFRSRRSLRFFHSPRRPHFRQSRGQSNKATENQPPRPDPTSQLGSPAGQPAQSFSERLRKLSREYGWTALGVYLALSALDFPFCFLAVRMLGTERIARAEHAIIHGFWAMISFPFPGGEEQVRGILRGAGDTFRGISDRVGPSRPAAKDPEANIEGAVLVKHAGQEPDGAMVEEEWSWGVEEAQAANRDNASLATQLALAYAIHKSFIFLRVPLTAAVLPRVVRTLRGWGWNIGKRSPKGTS
ncbi:MAG: hypothetical protein Q9162_002575 [Coniocarpon cinnabarinum]